MDVLTELRKFLDFIYSNCCCRTSLRRPLQSAIRSFNGDIDSIKILLEHDNSDINTRNLQGETPLHLAAQNPVCSIELIKLLLEHGADVKATTRSDGNTALHLLTISCKKSYVAIGVAEILLKHGSDINAVNSIRGETPFHSAVQNKICRSPELMMKLLLERGADVKATTRGDGNTPLHCIASGCRDNRIAIRVAKMLLDHGSDVNAVNSKGETPLLLALQNKVRSPKLIKLLLERGADVKATTREDGNTLLHRIILDNEWDLFTYLKILLEYGSDVNAVNAMGNTPLHLSIQDSYSNSIYIQQCSYSISLIKLLLSFGADVSIKNAKGENAVQIYCRVMEKDDSEQVDPLVRMLLMPANERQKHKITPLHIACLFHRFESVHKMLRLGADVNAIDSFGNSPLYYALIDSGDADKYSTMKLMLDYDAEIISDCGFNCVFLRRAKALDSIREPGNRSPFVNIILQHLAKISMLRQELIEKYIDGLVLTEGQDKFLRIFRNIVSNHVNEYEDLLTSCSKEVKLMRQTKINGSKVSFMDLLLVDPKTTMIYAKNKELIKAFNDKKTMFPMYQGMLDAKIGRDLERRKVIETAATVLSDALQFADPSDVFFERTLSYCSNQDLIHIIDENNEVDILERYEMNKSEMLLYY